MTFKPGQSGNPGGRPAGYNGLAKQIRAATNNGKELLDLLLDIARGQIPGGSTAKEKMVAAQILLNRGWGKAPETVEVISRRLEPTIDVRGWSVEKLEKVRALRDLLQPAVIPIESEPVGHYVRPDAPVPCLPPGLDDE